MGLRGPAPQLKLRSEPLEDLGPPHWLGTEAADFWNKHAQQLVENQLLTVQTADAYATLCDLWERLADFREQPTSKQFFDCLKAYQGLAKLFRLVPNEKPAVKEDRFTDFGEVEIE